MFQYRMARAVFGLALGFAALSMSASPGFAQTLRGPTAPNAEVEAAIGTLFGTPLGSEELAVNRARGTDPLATTLNQASFDGNTATGVSSGDAAMTGSVTSNSGFTTVFQNTGNNVLFQNSTTVNITLR